MEERKSSKRVTFHAARSSGFGIPLSHVGRSPILKGDSSDGKRLMVLVLAAIKTLLTSTILALE